MTEDQNFKEHFKHFIDASPGRVDRMMLLGLLGQELEWEKWRVEIPYLNFPAHWQVKIIPPFLTGIVRFLVKRKDQDDEDSVSVYLDCYDIAGIMGQPYWEIYPTAGNDTSRHLLNETEELLKAIEAALKK